MANNLQGMGARLQQLRAKMEEAKKQNHRDVVEEAKRKELPINFEAKKEREEKMLAEEKLKEECKKRGEDYSTIKMREWTAEEVEQWEKKKKKRKNPDEGFADYHQAAERKYQKLCNQIKPDMEAYEKEKERLGDDVFYAKVNTLGTIDHVDSREAIDRLAEDIEKQVAKKAKFSRRRTYNEDGDIDFINERNMKFNKKLERFFGKYTAEIKQNLERGTAI